MDPRARKLLRRLAEPVQVPALGVLDAAEALADEAGAELQPDFGREHVALIVGCNQFVRFRRMGDDAGHVELWLDPAEKNALAAAGFTLHEPHGAVFRMFGWVRIEPAEGDAAALRRAVAAAFSKARVTGKPAL